MPTFVSRFLHFDWLGSYAQKTAFWGYSASGDALMTSWSSQLDTAKTVNEVVALTRDHFAMWTPEEIALLPAPCRPAAFRDAVDIEELHRRALDEFRATRSSGEELGQLQKLLAYIARAALAVARLQAPAEADAGAPMAPAKKSAPVRGS